jgi:hypothetical protein
VGLSLILRHALRNRTLELCVTSAQNLVKQFILKVETEVYSRILELETTRIEQLKKRVDSV